MKKELIHNLTQDFESYAQQTDSDGAMRATSTCSATRNGTISRRSSPRAKTACEVTGHEIADHFADVPENGRALKGGLGSQREIADVMLTRFAIYLLAQNGDSGKQVAFAQTYFAVQTRKAELIEQRLLEAERVQAREKLEANREENSPKSFTN